MLDHDVCDDGGPPNELDVKTLLPLELLGLLGVDPLPVYILGRLR